MRNTARLTVCYASPFPPRTLISFEPCLQYGSHATCRTGLRNTSLKSVFFYQ